jgi:phosphoesterase RecJ-like protein
MANFATTLDWEAALAAVSKSKSVLLLAHVSPDADALGSALGLGLALVELGKSVQVSVGEAGFQAPESLNFLPGVHLIVSPENIADPDLVISCDVSSEKRLGIAADVMAEAKQSISIDHHPSFTGFGSIHLVDPFAAATAEIVLNFVDRLGVELNRDIASLIYAGLATDTGSFKYQATTSETMRAAARLLDAGIDHSGLARLLFDDEPMTAITMMGEAIGRAVLTKDAANGAGLVYTSISIAQRGDQSELAMERVIEAIRRITEAEVAAVFKQADDGHWNVSLRSKTLLSVGEVALSLGGGGHRFAAGYSTGASLADAIDQLIAKLAEVAGN